jgi:hypothetical protein
MEKETVNNKINKIIKNMSESRDNKKILCFDSDFNRKSYLSEGGITRIYTNDEKPLSERENFVYLLGKYRVAGPKESIYKIIEKLEIKSDEYSDYLITFSNYEEKFKKLQGNKKIDKENLSMNKINELRKMVHKSKKGDKQEEKSRSPSPHGKRISSRSNNKDNINSMKGFSKSIGKNKNDVIQVVNLLSETNKGLDITKILISNDTINGGKPYAVKTIQSRLKKLPVTYEKGFLIVEDKKQLEDFLKNIGHTDEEMEGIMKNYDEVEKKFDVMKGQVKLKQKKEEKKVVEEKKEEKIERKANRLVFTQEVSPCSSGNNSPTPCKLEVD